MFETPFFDRLAQASLDRYDEDTSTDGSAERPLPRIRQFIVVKEGRGICYVWYVTLAQLHLLSVSLTLKRSPVSTYGGSGTARPGINHRTHAIVYTQGTTPRHVSGERQLELPPIPVVPSNDGERLAPSCRIDFAIYYPMRHDIMVKDLGVVDKNSIPSLVQHARQQSGW